MPKRADIHSVLIIGAGPIVIGQACEFDYSGAQACKALKEEGFRVVLVNSNPATIMTDPEMAAATYIEPLRWQTLAEIIAKERPDALLPTMGGQTGLNCALDLAREGVLEQYGVEMIGANRAAIDKAEDRERFRDAMRRLGLAVPESAPARDLEQALAAQARLGYPVISRPSFTLGGSGGGIAYNREEFVDLVERGLEASPTGEVLLEKSVIGWKEYEMEVVRDAADNCIIVCSIENVDAMGVHTGDSITVAPAMTLTDKEYQRMRDASIAVLREIGVDTGGSNVQFAVNPADGEMIVIEMNPRVSRSSALASKATGFPIARVAAKLAVGYTLDELANEITGGAMPASFEPTLDYIVTKIPRFTFEKFPESEDQLSTQMKSVGEVMAIGRTFQESLQKAMRGLETGIDGFCPPPAVSGERGGNSGENKSEISEERIAQALRAPGSARLLYLGEAFRRGFDVPRVHALSGVDPWFLAQIEDLIIEEDRLRGRALHDLDRDALRRLKRKGFSDSRLAALLGVAESKARAWRQRRKARPVYKRVDSCAAEFAVDTAYLYSTYEEECEARPGKRDKVMVLGGGPNRIGQGIEFDYCCVHAAYAMREAGYETIMVNCNPETVSTDFDTSDRLYFEPLTLEDTLEIIDLEKPVGVIVQYGGQTPLRLARELAAAGAPIIGTSPDSIDLAEDRERFQQLLRRLRLRQPPNRVARTPDEALRQAAAIGYPLVVRPSYVLGGRAMEIVHEPAELRRYMRAAVTVSNDSPVLLDRFLEQAIEVDIDAVCDGSRVVIGGVMEHIEQAGVHSGDSACSLPPRSLDEATQARLREQATRLAKGLNVVGLMNAQFAIQGEQIYVLEVNPRASRTVPFVSKATGAPLAQIAAKCMVGISLDAQGVEEIAPPRGFAVKEAIFPFIRFPGVDPILGPEMKSTGEVMGIGADFGEAARKSLLAAGEELPRRGQVFLSARDADKPQAAEIAAALSELGFTLCATRGTAAALAAAGLDCQAVNKVREGRPHIVDMLKNDAIAMIVNTTQGRQAVSDSYSIRRTALQHKVFYTTTIAGAGAAVSALRQRRSGGVHSLQSLHKGLIR